MSMTITISNDVAQHLKSLSLGEVTDVNETLRSVLEAEYRRRLTELIGERPTHDDWWTD